MKGTTVKSLGLLFAVLLIAGCGSQPAKTQASNGPVSFAKDIQPMFSQNCMPCHSGSPGCASPYALTSYAGAMGNGKDSVPNVLPGNADSSLLCQMLKSGTMPKTGPLAPAKVELVTGWVTQGAKNN
jgi:hypothetical protein